MSGNPFSIVKFFEDRKELQYPGVTGYGKDDSAKKSTDISIEPKSLNLSEYQILIMLVENLGKIIQKKEINKNIFNINEEIDSRTVDTHIHSIRKKIKESECIISTIRSVGFLFEAS